MVDGKRVEVEEGGGGAGDAPDSDVGVPSSRRGVAGGPGFLSRGEADVDAVESVHNRGLGGFPGNPFDDDLLAARFDGGTRQDRDSIALPFESRTKTSPVNWRAGRRRQQSRG